MYVCVLCANLKIIFWCFLQLTKASLKYACALFATCGYRVWGASNLAHGKATHGRGAPWKRIPSPEVRERSLRPEEARGQDGKPQLLGWHRGSLEGTNLRFDLFMRCTVGARMRTT